MTVQEAFETLDLPEMTTLDEIENKYKALIKKFHPDKQNGNHDRATKLNVSRKVAIKHIEEMNSTLAIIKQVTELIRVDNTELIKIQGYKNQSDYIFKKITRNSVNKYKQMQSITKLLGAFTAGLALVTSNALPIFEKITANNPYLSIVFTLATFALGFYYLMFNTITERMKDSLDDFKEILDDKSSYYEIVNSIVIENSDLNQVFSRSEFEHNINKWLNASRHIILEELELDLINDKNSLRKIAGKIGVTDFTKLIISKGLEKGIIKEVDIIENGLPTIRYSFEKYNANT